MVNLNSIKRTLITNAKNIPGWSNKKKIVAFISDDWGDLRVHSDKEYEQLVNKGIPVDRSPHTKVESLATEKDLYDLFELLSSVKDHTGRHAVISPFTIMANPDFQKIEASGFTEYHYKPFTETLLDRDGNSGTIDAWKKGIEDKLFLPEMHGKEHVSVPVWMRKLQNNEGLYRFCFQNRFAHYTEPSMPHPIVATYYFENAEDFKVINRGVSEGINLFGKTFGYKPTAFNPPNAIFHPDYYSALASGGITNLDTSHMRVEPDGKGGSAQKRYRFGEVSEEGLVHFVSNCAFEPVKEIPDVVETTLNQVRAAFRWNKPALINTHRINYVSGRGNHTRENNLRALKQLLDQILKQWPDAEFMGVGEFSQYMNSTLKRTY